MKPIIFFVILLSTVQAQSETNRIGRVFEPGWYGSVVGAAVHNQKAGVDGGGDLSVDRYYIQGGVARLWRQDRIVLFSGGYGRDDYRFSGRSSDPWDQIENYRLSAMVRWRLDNAWSVFAAPSVRSYGETGTDFSDTLTASFFGGGSYHFSEKLMIGPGIGVSGQLEDDTQLFPFLLIDWRITDRLRLGTGGGTAATAGPGLSLTYEASRRWKLGVGGRYEKKRFRLDSSSNRVPGGVGQDRNIPVVGTIDYVLYPASYIRAIIGYNIGGKYSVSNRDGDFLHEHRYDDAPFFGLMASIWF